MYRKIFKSILLVSCALAITLLPFKNALAASFNSSNLISNGEFIGINSMSASDIQNFLNDKGSCLKNYSQNGRSAAQIIYDASHGYGEASGSVNGITINTSTGTVSPGVILATLQKEQSLISSSSCSDGAINAAMGYGCPDSGGCNPTYAGFTNQVEWGAWQLRYNYERAYGHGFSDYQVGQSFCFDDWNGTHCGTYGNQATASLYRYTPHVYNGNYNFWNLYYNTYQFQVPAYSYSYLSQNANPRLVAGGSGYKFVLRVKNTGTATWRQSTVRLGTSNGKDRISAFLREGGSPSGWLSGNRIQMKETSVAPGGTATFEFYMKNRTVSPGNYREYFQLVADGVGWMEDYGIYWNITVPQPTPSYSYSYVSQNSYPTLTAGGSGYKFIIRAKNTGTKTWTQNVVRLGTSRGHDRISGFLREGGDPSGWLSANRIKMKETSVAPGATATFEFYMKAPSGMPSGTYREYFQLVADGVGWMQDYGIYWDVRVNRTTVTPTPSTPSYSYSYVSQNSYPTLTAGGSGYKFIIRAKNTGTKTWTQNVVRLGTSRGHDRISGFLREGGDPSGWLSANRIKMKETSVAPGATATFEFYMKAPSGMPSGTYREYFQLVADGVGWMQDYGIYWDVKVR